MEKKNVIIWNLAEKYFPAEPDNGDTDDSLINHFEEERRVLYVAMTRAQINLHLIFQRCKVGIRSKRFYEPSRYFADFGMNPALIAQELDKSEKFDQALIVDEEQKTDGLEH